MSQNSGTPPNIPNQSIRTGGRTTQLSNSTSIVRRTLLKKSTRLALYLYIQAHYKLEDKQLEYIAHFQAKLNLDEIQSALKFMHVLTTDPRTRARMHVGEHHSDVENQRQVPFTQQRPKLPQQRRIGVGYRDKGSLPKPARMNWDKENIRAVSLPEGTAVFSFLLLEDLIEELHGKESSEVLSRILVNYPEARILLRIPTLEVKSTGKNSWKIQEIQ